jgi:predicted HicB family RNase H-like nuclease
MTANVLTYKSYSARVEFDADDGVFCGRIAGLQDVISFHGQTVDHLIEAFHEAVDDYLATCTRLGKTPDRPFSGKLMLRIDPRVHAASVRAAQLAGISLNQWGERVLEEAARGQ